MMLLKGDLKSINTKKALCTMLRSTIPYYLVVFVGMLECNPGRGDTPKNSLKLQNSNSNPRKGKNVRFEDPFCQVLPNSLEELTSNKSCDKNYSCNIQHKTREALSSSAPTAPNIANGSGCSIYDIPTIPAVPCENKIGANDRKQRDKLTFAKINQQAKPLIDNNPGSERNQENIYVNYKSNKVNSQNVLQNHDYSDGGYINMGSRDISKQQTSSPGWRRYVKPNDSRPKEGYEELDSEGTSIQNPIIPSSLNSNKAAVIASYNPDDKIKAFNNSTTVSGHGISNKSGITDSEFSTQKSEKKGFFKRLRKLMPWGNRQDPETREIVQVGTLDRKSMSRNGKRESRNKVRRCSSCNARMSSQAKETEESAKTATSCSQNENGLAHQNVLNLENMPTNAPENNEKGQNKSCASVSQSNEQLISFANPEEIGSESMNFPQLNITVTVQVTKEHH